MQANPASRKPTMPHHPDVLDTLPDSAMLRLADLLELRLWPGARSSLWKAVAEGRFPQPIKVGENTTAWLLGDLRAWQQSLVPTPSREEFV